MKIRHFKFLLISCFFLVILNHYLTHAESNTIEVKNIGKIFTIDFKNRIGTAFVAGETNKIFMPAHVAIDDTLIFFPFNSEFWFRISIKYVLNDFDLAIYQRTGGEHQDGYPLGKIDRMQPGDTISYYGWENDSTLYLGKSIISAKGQAIAKNEIIDFIDFVGHGIPGFSGGPVFSNKGEVIAMIVSAWDFKPIRSETSYRVLRAYSVDMLRVLEQHLETSTVVDSSVNVEKLRLLDIIETK